MREKKQAAPETLMIRLARVAGSVAGTLAAKTAKVVARTESSSRGRRSNPSESLAANPKPARSRKKKKAKRAGQRAKRKPNRSTAS